MRATTLTRWLHGWPARSINPFFKFFRKENSSEYKQPELRKWLVVLVLAMMSQGAFGQVGNSTLPVASSSTSCLPMPYDNYDCEDQNRPINSVGYYSNPAPADKVTKGSTITICGVTPSFLSVGKTIILIEALYGDPDPNGVTVEPNVLLGSITANISYKVELYRKKVIHMGDHVWKKQITVPCDFNLLGIRLSYLKKKAFDKDVNKNYKCFTKHDWVAIPELKVMTPPEHQIITTCEGGLQEFIINNRPDNSADTLYIIPPNPFFLNGNYNLSHPFPNHAFTGILKVPRDPSDSKFHFFHDLQFSQQFLMSYGQNNFSEIYSCDDGIRLSQFALLTLLKIDIPQLETPEILYHPLLDCPAVDSLSCFTLIPFSAYETDSMVSLAFHNIDTNSIKGVSFDVSGMYADVRSRWSDTQYLTNSSKVCYDDLEGGKNGCRTYTLYLDITFRFRIGKASLGGPHGVLIDTNLVPDQFLYIAGICSYPIKEQTFCRLQMPPKAQFKLRCDADEPVCFLCKPGWDGIRVFESFLDTDPRQTPPQRSGIHVGDLGWYYNCGEDVQGPNHHDDGTVLGGRQARLNMEERFCVSDSLLHEIGADPRLLWVDYVKYNNNGTVVDSSYQKSPLGIFTMPQGLLQQSPMAFELDKPINEADSCTIPFAIPILDSVFIDNDSIENLIQGMIDNFNLEVDLNYGPEPPFNLELEDFSFGLTGPTYNYQGNRTICYTNLPPEPGSCQEYNLSFTYKLRYTNPDICYPLGGDTRVDSCRTELVTVDVCKRMYPPMPEVFIICDKDEPLINENVCLDEPVESYQRYKWELINASPGLPNIYYSSGNCLDSLTYIEIENNSFADSTSPGYLNFLVSAVASNGNESTKSPISIVGLFGDPTEISSQHGLQKPITVSSNDYDSYNMYCSSSNPEPGTFWDLSIDSAAANQQLQSLIDLVNQTNFVHLTNMSEISWTPHEYEVYQGLYRVCYGHLPDGDPDFGDDKSITYTGTFTPKLSVCFSGLNIENLNLDERVLYLELYGLDTLTGTICDTVQSCPKDLMTQKVYKVQLVNGSNPCTSDPVEIINGYQGTNAQDCDNLSALSVCEGDTAILGYDIGLLGTVDSVRWIVPFANLTSSLSSLTTQYPTWYYPNNINYPPGTTLLYKCLIYYRNALNQVDSLVHCEMIHLCGNCSSLIAVNDNVQQNMIDQVANSDTVKESTVIITPNPFHKTFNFQASNVKSKEVNFRIFSLDGKLINSGVSQKANKQYPIDCSNCENGVYLLVIDSPEEQIKMTLRIDSVNN